MQVTIISIDQKLLLNGTSELHTFVTMRLPAGGDVSVRVEPDVAQALIIAATGASDDPIQARDEEAASTLDSSTHEGDDVFGGEDTQTEDAGVEWATLPDEHLSAHMKETLTSLQAPAVLPMSELVALVDQITEATLERKRKQQQRQRPQPVVGAVQRLQPVARPKTVPRDEMGYPIVSRNDRDPGEVALTGTDEDGVPQL